MDERLASYIAQLPPASGRTQSDPLAGSEPSGSFTAQLRAAGLIWRFGVLIAAHVLETGFLLASWVFIGSGALSGRLDYGWLAAWALCLSSTAPLRLASTWLEGTISLGFSGLLKERLLVGAIRIDGEYIRRKGAGEFLSEVLESEAIERLGVSGVLDTVLAALELLMAPFLFAWGAAANLEISFLTAWLGLTLILFGRNLRLRAGWTKMRLDLTHRLVEKMSAQRTRLAQQPPSEWHADEDCDNESYAAVSERLDQSTAWISAAAPRGYVMVAFGALTPAFLSGGATLERLAITLGTILFTGSALERFVIGLARGSVAWIAWRSVKPMFDAAGQPIAPDVPDMGESEAKALLAQDLVFTHEGRSEPSIKGCTLAIERGDRLLLQGESGSGKSTFASVLAGLRRPSSGFILAGGLDRQTLGDVNWRRRIAVAPQYHENHILAAPLAFNLLLARPYPHSSEDLREARELCEELGLGPLVERMPGGMDQMVGETGWQLSQGERSRVFLARALLQNAEVVLLDESLSALDPDNLRQCLECALRRVRTLMVIAHP